ncbi:MFS transporter, UMF1 family [Mariprofundus ferrinatatus]|uniref:MFS transporter, UMF1 family n=1 Tax=Mariprofundus ferrinatatus TaxID=1921087 RepID=A0A2K8L2R9_9PROT|nr:MFS transporter [Mariprofundus ferrinatatus]ATX81630.1 MFS transporter, UMF1 family [Mariprofundus ferrinatatus]
MGKSNRKAIYSWALYDWANSAYTTTVMAGFFPIFFKQYWAHDLTANESTFWLGVANAVAGLVIALLAPVLGAMADQGGLKKQMMLSFTSLAVVMTAALFLVAEGQWLMAVLVYLFGAIAFSGANVFYDALIVDVAEHHELDRVSALGYGLGYIGGGILFAVNVLMTLHPEWFFLADKAEAVRWSFLSVALWWALFTLPVAFFVHEAGGSGRMGLVASARAGFHQLSDTIHHLRSLKQVWLFLIAYFLYIDGVNTVAHMAVDYGLSLGFEADVLIAALLLTQFIAFPSAIAAGWLGERFGAKRVIIASIAVYAIACIWSSTMQNANDFYWLAAAIGLVMGGIQALSRSMYARIIPRKQATEFFGFFNMLGKFATVFGPLLMGVASVVSGSARFSILVIVALFAAGAIVLYYVDEHRQEVKS